MPPYKGWLAVTKQENPVATTAISGAEAADFVQDLVREVVEGSDHG